MYRLRRIRWMPLMLLILSFFVVMGIFTAMTATNIVSESRAGDTTHPLDYQEILPVECNGITVTDVLVVTSSNFLNPYMGTGANELILGTPNTDYIDGGGGDDCILGGGDDCILGGGGNDGFCFWFFCFGLSGGDGDDVILGGPGNDVCLGDGGADSFVSCETATQ